jgi:hypothetical protein
MNDLKDATLALEAAIAERLRRLFGGWSVRVNAQAHSEASTSFHASLADAGGSRRLIVAAHLWDAGPEPLAVEMLRCLAENAPTEEGSKRCA